MMSVVTAMPGRAARSFGQPLEVRGDRVVAPHPLEHAVRPLWTGRWKCGAIFGSVRKASMSASERSCGWLVVNRTRSMPGTWATRSRSSAKEMPPRYEFTFWPMRVTSRTPTRVSDATSSSTSAKGAADLAAAGVRDDAEAADVVAALHHGDELGHLARASCSGSARGKTYSSESTQAVSTMRDPVLDDAREHLGQLADGVGAEDEVQVRHPLEELAPSPAGRRSRPRRGALRAESSPGPVAPQRREHLVLGLLPDGAGVEDDEVRVAPPSAWGGSRWLASASPIRSESLTFIWQPKVWM